MEPVTAAIIASAIAAAAKGTGEAISSSKAKKAAKEKLKEMRRETRGGLLESAMQRRAELEGHRLSSKARKAKRSTQSLGETSDIVRGALNI